MTRLLLSLATAAALAAPLAIAAPAQAQSWDPHGGYSSQRRDDRCDCYDYGARQQYDYRSEERQGGYGPSYAPPPAGGSYYAPQGGPANNMGYFEQYEPGRSAFRPGLLLPPYFRGYMVTERRLARKRGYAWYRVGNEYIQADTASGEITSIVTFP